MNPLRINVALLIILLSNVLPTTVSAGKNRISLPPQPNDIPSTVPGCASAILSADQDENGVITRDEYLGFANQVDNLLCQEASTELTFDLQTVFITIACLCDDLLGQSTECCFGSDAGIFIEGADLPQDERTSQQADYLRSVCLLTQAVMGESECGEGGSTSTSFEDFSGDNTSDTSAVVASSSSADSGFKADADDVSGALQGCAAALIENDDDGDGSIRRDEFLDFVNDMADLLCVPPKPELDLQLQTTFISLACLCLERDGFVSDCCFADNAAIDLSVLSGFRSEDDETYLRAVCVLTQAVFGHSQCHSSNSAATGDVEETDEEETDSTTAAPTDVVEEEEETDDSTASSAATTTAPSDVILAAQEFEPEEEDSSMMAVQAEEAATLGPSFEATLDPTFDASLRGSFEATIDATVDTEISK